MKINYAIKNYKEFLKLDELNKEVKKLCPHNEILNLGFSEEKNEIIGVKLGNGKENALVFGAPHVNEPVGCLTCLELIKIIKSNKNLQKKYTWYIVPCSDPDGIRLNESWFKGKFSIKKYVYGYYRSPPILQSEWSFPVKYKKYKFEKNPKHNDALKNLIDKIKPKINYPLHNAGFSGAFFLLSHKMPKNYYYKVLRLCKKLKIPLDDESGKIYPFMKKLDKGIYVVPSFEEIYDFLEENKQNPLKTMEQGQTSIHYVKKLVPNVFGIVGEIPYIYDNKIEDKTKISKTRREVNRKKFEESIENKKFITKNLNKKGINKKSPFYLMLKKGTAKDLYEDLARLEKIKEKSYSVKTTISEEFYSDVINKFYISLDLGAFYRLLKDSKKSKETENLKREVKERIEIFTKYVEENSNYKIIPIKNLINIQLGCLFYALDFL